MDYRVIYENLIHKRKSQIILNGEFHHIIPKCVGGTDSSDNLVKLTNREHRFAHLLLPKIYPNSVGLKVAANLFSEKRVKYPVWNKDVPMEESQKLKIKQSKTGRSLSESHKLSIKSATKRKTKIRIYNNLVEYQFESVKEASRFLKVPHQNIFRVLRKIRKSVKGYNIVYG